jgi:hypothetical protein
MQELTPKTFFKNAIFPRKLWSKYLNPIGYGYGFCKNLAFIKVWLGSMTFGLVVQKFLNTE